MGLPGAFGLYCSTRPSAQEYEPLKLKSRFWGMIVALMVPWKVSTVSVRSESQSREGSSGFRTELRCFWKLDSCT
jgi:hypothetical protein